MVRLAPFDAAGGFQAVPLKCPEFRARNFRRRRPQAGCTELALANVQNLNAGQQRLTCLRRSWQGIPPSKTQTSALLCPTRPTSPCPGRSADKIHPVGQRRAGSRRAEPPHSTPTGSRYAEYPGPGMYLAPCFVNTPSRDHASQHICQAIRMHRSRVSWRSLQPSPPDFAEDRQGDAPSMLLQHVHDAAVVGLVGRIGWL